MKPVLRKKMESSSEEVDLFSGAKYEESFAAFSRQRPWSQRPRGNNYVMITLC
jgi:hypothetical protein